MVLSQNQHVDQECSTGDPHINPHSNGHVVFEKGIINTHWGADSLSAVGAGETAHAHKEGD